MKRILMIDNYDSFTYNLVQLVMSNVQVDMVVRRNDAFALDDVLSIAPDGIIISPGPKRPEDAGRSLEVIAALGERIPILGVCLGMQCINEVFGGRTREAEVPVHGKTSRISHGGHGLFRGVANPIAVARYHSLRIDDIPPCLEVDAHTEPDRIPMAIHHRDYPIYGVQFHPESFMTEHGNTVINNYLNLL
jgi:anthranilate synthase component 2